MGAFGLVDYFPNSIASKTVKTCYFFGNVFEKIPDIFRQRNMENRVNHNIDTCINSAVNRAIAIKNRGDCDLLVANSNWKINTANISLFISSRCSRNLIFIQGQSRFV